MNTSLTTFDGFPRSDIDVAQSTRTVFIKLTHNLTNIGSSYYKSADNTATE